MKPGKDVDIKWYSGAEEVRLTTTKWVKEDIVGRLKDGLFHSEPDQVLQKMMGNEWFTTLSQVRAEPRA